MFLEASPAVPPLQHAQPAAALYVHLYTFAGF